MKTFMLVLMAAVLSTAATAQSSAQKTLRVDRPEKGVGARVTHVRLIRGEVPRRVHAVIVTDTRCTPDMQGVSHCLNKMRLPSGKIVMVVHDHMMMRMPCLSPGERVLLTPSK